MVAIQIRGTSGSGKTWIIKKLMNEYKFTPVIVNEKIFGYKSKQLNVFIPGRYETACGGCDTIKTQDEICRRVKLGIKNGYSVLFEGLLSSHLAERFFKLYSELNESNVDSYFIFLNTPLSTCEENINKRRLEAGKSPKKAKTVESHYHSTKSLEKT